MAVASNMALLEKQWDRHVAEAEEVARTHGFIALRDCILERASAGAGETVVDVGAGTGLLTLAVAGRAEKVWAIDVAPAMSEYLRAKAQSAGLQNVETVTASAISLPLVSESVDVVLSNYCLHHLRGEEKQRALAEMHRVLVPGGRLVIGDMMFRLSLGAPRDRRLVAGKVRSIARRGPAGFARLAKNACRVLTRRWESPERADWWQAAIEQAGFVDVSVETMAHEGGIAAARKPRSAENLVALSA